MLPHVHRTSEWKSAGHQVFQAVPRPLATDMVTALGTGSNSGYQPRQALNDSRQWHHGFFESGVTLSLIKQKSRSPRCDGGKHARRAEDHPRRSLQGVRGAAAASGRRGDKMGSCVSPVKETVGTALFPALDKMRRLTRSSNFVGSHQSLLVASENLPRLSAWCWWRLGWSYCRRVGLYGSPLLLRSYHTWYIIFWSRSSRFSR